MSPTKTVQIVESFLNDKGLPRQRIVQHAGVAFDEPRLKQLWTMAENLIPALEHRAVEEKLATSGQTPLFHFPSGDYQKEIPVQRTTHVDKMVKIEDILEGPFEV
ncbi:MAG: hypothetical protein LBD04_09945 [Synergistaceae bacterium]|nr:hypothetical protein [Synergistaceae bacterium]